jgi:uncharacterized protein
VVLLDPAGPAVRFVAMDLRRRLPIAFTVALLLAGCADDAPANSPEAAQADEPDAGPAEVPPATGEAVPPLHPVIDGWDEVAVVIEAGEGSEGREHDRVEVAAKVAVTDAQRQRGLMEVEDLPDGIGMLFLFETERTGGFWMRNTLVPLDIAYLDADGTIGTILAMDPCVAAEASDCPVYTPEDPYVAALEVPQGWFGRAGVDVGDAVRWSDPVAAT